VIKLIVGLGNPGRQYEKNRHNAGFLFLDRLCEKYSANWATESRFSGIIATCFVGANKVILLKPQAFMNRSGLSVGTVARYFKIKAEEILVVHDELDLDAGVVKLKEGGGHAGHNGLRDIIEKLGEKNFYRLRVGIGRPPAGKKVADYVLSNPSKEEWVATLRLFDRVDEQINKVVAGEMGAAMSELNKSLAN
jgi:PTH1 family peptidyl-tRNA hydrolase